MQRLIPPENIGNRWKICNKKPLIFITFQNIIELSRAYFSIVIQQRRNMFSFCNVDSQCPHFYFSPFELNKAVQLGVTSMEHSLAAKSVQIRASSGKCNKPASAVF